MAKTDGTVCDMANLRAKLYGTLRQMSIRLRLQLIIAVVTILVVMAFLLMTTTIFQSYTSYLDLSCTRMVGLISDNLNTGINSMLSASKYPVIWIKGSQATDTYRYLAAPDRFPARMIQNDLENQSYFMFEQDRQLRFIAVFALDGNGYYIKNSTKWEYLVTDYYQNLHYDDPMAQQWLAQSTDAMGKTLLHHPDELDLTQIVLPGIDQMLFLSRAVVNIERYRPVGVVLCGVNVSQVGDIVRQAQVIKSQRMGFVDGTGRLLWGDMEQPSIQLFIEGLAKQSVNDGSFVAGSGMGKMMYHYATAPIGDCYYVVETPYTEAVLQWLAGRALMLAVLLGGCTLVCLAINRVAQSIATPIKSLVTSCDELSKGDFTISVDDPYNDEISELSGAFNSMTREIEHLIYEVYDKQMEASRNEIQLLRSQINPHFLYNTLETIRTKALLDGKQELCDIAFLLATILRYGINAPTETVTVGTEIEMLEKYMRLQKLLYQDRFVETIKIEQYVMQCTILKFLLQPLVENALYHGICSRSGNGFIEVLGFVAEQSIVFQVSDNGCGIDSETVELLNGYINGNNNAFTSIGLKNVNRRAKLTYGDEYGIVVQSRVGQGTMITLTIPLHQSLTEQNEETLEDV